jgi:hypothetical protein
VKENEYAMRGNTLVGSTLILVLCFFSCSDLGVELRKDPSGTFDFTRHNAMGNVLSQGTLTINFQSDSTISGEWNIINGGSGGVLFGTFRNESVFLDFTGGCLACIDFVQARLMHNRLDGKWFTGVQWSVTDSGRFIATRR